LIRTLALAAALLLLAIPALWAAEGAILVTEDVQLRVADAFLQEKEYYRAITEYKRFLILFPDSTRGDYALLQVGTAYSQGGDHDGAARNFSALREKYPQSLFAGDACFFEGMSYWKKKEYEKAGSLFLALVDAYPGSSYAPRAMAAAALIELDRGNPEAAQGLLHRFVATYPDHPKIDSVREAMSLLEGYADLPQKSMALAGIMSIVLPGAGYAYAGDYGTAVMSLLVNGAFIAGAWTAFAQELYAVGALVAGVGVPFYAGNIYGSALAVKKWNQAVKQEARDRIYAALDFVFE
jgi:outer membrane protein assembly factor BamD (BamD/ComL family)